MTWGGGLQVITPMLAFFLRLFPKDFNFIIFLPINFTQYARKSFSSPPLSPSVLFDIPGVPTVKTDGQEVKVPTQGSKETGSRFEKEGATVGGGGAVSAQTS